MAIGQIADNEKGLSVRTKLNSLIVRVNQSVSVKDTEFGAVGDGVADDTAAIQSAIDSVNLAGGGIVFIPAGTYSLSASTLNETLWNSGVSVSSSLACLILRDNVALIGDGIEVSTLFVSGGVLSCIFISDGNNAQIRNLSIDGNDPTAANGGHAVIQFTSANDIDTAIDNILIDNYLAKNVGSYGVGIENGLLTNVILSNIRTLNTGADGIDIKNRSTTTDNKGFFLSNIYIDTFGLRLDGQAGVDMRGIVNASGVQVVNAGRAGVTQDGIRFRSLGPSGPNDWARRSTITGFYVRSNDSTNINTTGLNCASSDVNISNGVIEDCNDGVVLTGNASGNADRTSVFGVIVDNSVGEAFGTATNLQDTKYISCTAKDSGVGFRDEGSDTIIIGCTSPGTTTGLSTSVGAANTQLAIGNILFDDYLEHRFVIAGRVGVTAVGASTNIDIALEPKGTGLIRVGTHTAIGAETVTGFIIIKDSSGASRKIAVVS